MPHGGRRKGAGRKLGSSHNLTAEMWERAMALGPEALERIGKLAQTAESENAQVSAANLLLNRGFGRPQQADSDPHITVKVERVYRWARNEDEATLDPARPRLQNLNASERKGQKTSVQVQVKRDTPAKSRTKVAKK